MIRITVEQDRQRDETMVVMPEDKNYSLDYDKLARLAFMGFVINATGIVTLRHGSEVRNYDFITH